MMHIEKINHRPEIWVFLFLLALANFTLFSGSVCEPLLYLPDEVRNGQWWRTLSFPLVHVSWYHLLMDAGAFLFLYHGLQTVSLAKRLLYVGTSIIGTLVVSLTADSLCGLSGVAHGLMVVTGLEMMVMRDSFMRKTGLACFVLVVVKSIYEAWSGQVAFQFLHLGEIGKAVAVCHAGGTLGGIIGFSLARGHKRAAHTR